MANIFDKLAKKGRKVDEGIRRLDRLWEIPPVFISKSETQVEEASKHLENFLETIKDIHDELLEDTQPRTDYIVDVNRFMAECRTVYEHLKQEVDEIEVRFAELGYEVLPKLNQSTETPEEVSILDTADMIDNLVITDSSENEAHDSNQENVSPTKSHTEQPPKYIATPVIKSLASVMHSEVSGRSTYTPPLKAIPQEPIYSPYYYQV